MIAFQRIEDESFVSLGDLGFREATFVGQIHLNWHGARYQPGRLCVDLHVDSLRGLDPEHELVASDVVEDTLGDILILDADLHLGLVERCW